MTAVVFQYSVVYFSFPVPDRFYLFVLCEIRYRKLDQVCRKNNTK